MINFALLTTTAVYVGTKDVYVAQLKRTLFGVRLVKFGKTEIQAPAQTSAQARQQKQAIVQAIKKVVQENNITAKKVVSAVAGKEVLIRYFQMPRIPKAEWAAAVKFEAKKYIPFKLEGLVWDFRVALPKGKDAKMDVTFVAVKKEVAQRHQSLLEEAGLKVSLLEPAPFSLLRLFTAGNQLAKDRPTAIVDVDYGMADINIVKNRICYLTRDVSLPLEEEVVFDNLLNEIRMSLDYYEKLFPAEVVAKVLLCGEMELKDWDRSLAEELKLPVEKADLARVVKIQKVLPPLSMAIAIGLGLRGLTKAAAEVNLYPAGELKPKVAPAKGAFEFTPEVRQAVFRAVALSCIGLLAVHLAMYPPIARKNKQLELIRSLKPKIGLPISSLPYLKLEQTRGDLKNKLSALNLIIDKRISWTTKFNELPKLIPSGVWLTNLSFNQKISKSNKLSRSLILKGVAYHENPGRGIEVITTFVSELKENKGFSRGFKEIKLDSMASAQLEGIAVKGFTISCSSKE